VVKRLQARVAQLEAQNLAEVERAKAAAARAAHLEDKLGKAKQQVQSWRKLYLEEVHANKQRR
jgi:outer membrane murein-binding lipoprotein Lpp